MPDFESRDLQYFLMLDKLTRNARVETGVVTESASTDTVASDPVD